MSKIEELEPRVHAREREESSDEMYSRKIKPVEGAQWTGNVTIIAAEMLKANLVEAVICVQSHPADRLAPRPVSFPLSPLNWPTLHFVYLIENDSLLKHAICFQCPVQRSTVCLC